MTRTERKKLDCLLRCLAADDEETRREALDEARELLRGSAETQEANVSEVIEDLLTEIGVPSHFNGYDYLVCCIHHAYKHPDTLHALTKELYPHAARTFNARNQCVERSIRAAIARVFDHGDIDELKQFFGNTVSCHKGVPTNGHFISTCVREVTRRCGEG